MELLEQNVNEYLRMYTHLLTDFPLLLNSALYNPTTVIKSTHAETLGSANVSQDTHSFLMLRAWEDLNGQVLPGNFHASHQSLPKERVPMCLLACSFMGAKRSYLELH